MNLGTRINIIRGLTKYHNYLTLEQVPFIATHLCNNGQVVDLVHNTVCVLNTSWLVELTHCNHYRCVTHSVMLSLFLEG